MASDLATTDAVLEQVTRVGFVLTATTDQGTSVGWVLTRTPQVLVLSATLSADIGLLAVGPAPGTSGPSGELLFDSPAAIGAATGRLLTRVGYDQLPSAPWQVCGARARRLLLERPLVDAGWDRESLVSAAADGGDPWALVPDHVRRLAGPAAADALVDAQVVLHPHVPLAAGALAALDPSGRIADDGRVEVSGSGPPWVAEACGWLGTNAVAALTARAVAG